MFKKAKKKGITIISHMGRSNSWDVSFDQHFRTQKIGIKHNDFPESFNRDLASDKTDIEERIDSLTKLANEIKVKVTIQQESRKEIDASTEASNKKVRRRHGPSKAKFVDRLLFESSIINLHL
ncbi:unnamed protein product [Blepharisma stoltei]|uniref:Transposase n=1 Tax=Blepharisma stoltei TaxID=1481888 RepID=A0AAU9JA05_9CILI|nr:unnamed protein product [Blepharisma stoltei]